ncbi:hypothetical protein EZV62_004728 [Acer yangbiense]|uniref:BTB domain-containing protein n=1 Tax=Acer yangbiense TaxID=1000413 RepID=A0A5C7IKI0_9ROSI|nr:hypothetical protein EZV62_004728 [Acer yangbiense]
MAKSIPGLLSKKALAVVEALEGKQVETFMTALRDMSEESALHLKKLDKKSERTLLHSYRKDLTYQVSAETEPISLLSKVVSLLYMQDKLHDSVYKILTDYRTATVALLALMSAATGDVSYAHQGFQMMSLLKLESGPSISTRCGEFTGEAEKKIVLQLHDMPGGVEAFLLIAKFCYGVKIDLTVLNVVSIRCAAEYLQMSEEYGEGNLTILTENFLNEVFGNWTDSIRALEAREEVLPYAEELHIVSRCINSLAMKACADPSLFSWPMPGHSDVQSPGGTVLWNGISVTAKSQSLIEDLSFL